MIMSFLMIMTILIKIPKKYFDDDDDDDDDNNDILSQ